MVTSKPKKKMVLIDDYYGLTSKNVAHIKKPMAFYVIAPILKKKTEH